MSGKPIDRLLDSLTGVTRVYTVLMWTYVAAALLLAVATLTAMWTLWCSLQQLARAWMY